MGVVFAAQHGAGEFLAIKFAAAHALTHDHPVAAPGVVRAVARCWVDGAAELADDEHSHFLAHACCAHGLVERGHGAGQLRQLGVQVGVAAGVVGVALVGMRVKAAPLRVVNLPRGPRRFVVRQDLGNEFHALVDVAGAKVALRVGGCAVGDGDFLGIRKHAFEAAGEFGLHMVGRLQAPEGCEGLRPVVVGRRQVGSAHPFGAASVGHDHAAVLTQNKRVFIGVDCEQRCLEAAVGVKCFDATPTPAAGVGVAQPALHKLCLLGVRVQKRWQGGAAVEHIGGGGGFDERARVDHKAQALVGEQRQQAGHGFVQAHAVTQVRAGQAAELVTRERDAGAGLGVVGVAAVQRHQDVVAVAATIEMNNHQRFVARGRGRVAVDRIQAERGAEGAQAPTRGLLEEMSAVGHFTTP